MKTPEASDFLEVCKQSLGVSRYFSKVDIPRLNQPKKLEKFLRDMEVLQNRSISIMDRHATLVNRMTNK